MAAVAVGTAADVSATDTLATAVVDGVVVVARGVLVMVRSRGAVHEMMCAALASDCRVVLLAFWVGLGGTFSDVHWNSFGSVGTRYFLYNSLICRAQPLTIYMLIID